ncbi:DUF5635 domain-containing protein [Kineococcus arenarius]|uniref:DUF5635 domain-containing protein n=1 Tax=Kineococcus sp. SYSU DK007 TaxID=3383128 RepID=UPI003D7F0ADE
METERVDFKEERGRRGAGGRVHPGEPRNQAVAEQLADEVACLANSVGGGALIIGVADDGSLIGADTDRDWLRQRISERIDVAPAVDERFLPDGTRVLVVLVAEAREPVADTLDRLRWRVGATCAPVDRSEWWAQRLRRQGHDPLLATTTRTSADLAPGAVGAVQRLLRSTAGDPGMLADLPARDLLTRLGALLPDGHLTAAGALMFCPSPRTIIELVALDVPGGSVVLPPPDLSGLSVVEQLVEVETRLDALDTGVPQQAGLRIASVRRVPWPAVREVLLNAVVHRDWLPADPVRVTWVQEDATLDVVSPGGFAGGVTAGSVLSARYSRNPALADLTRAMGLVERQGVGVDRMYRDMVALGHRAPSIREETGPQVRARLVGGHPLAAVVAVTTGVTPVVRQQDVRVVLAVHALLRDGFVTPTTLAELLQVPEDEAVDALDVVSTCTIAGKPVAQLTGTATWTAGSGLTTAATSDTTAVAVAKRRGLLTWWRPDALGARRLVETWLRSHERITSGEVSSITTFSGQASLSLLQRLEADGFVQRGASRGRSAHFLRAGDSEGEPSSSPVRR